MIFAAGVDSIVASNTDDFFQSSSYSPYKMPPKTISKMSVLALRKEGGALTTPPPELSPKNYFSPWGAPAPTEPRDPPKVATGSTPLLWSHIVTDALEIS